MAEKQRKPPQNTPAKGDRVRLRGRDAVGTLRTINPENQWCKVGWDEGQTGPLVCHLFELEKLPSP